MFAGVQKCLDENDVIGLRYIFSDSLDVDPTFETYREDYEACCRVEGFFEPHVEKTPFIGRNGWDMDYWVKLKIDLSNNFSQKRFEHMIEAAKVVYADKVARLLQERGEARAAEKPAAPPPAPPRAPVVSSAPALDPEEEQNRMLAEKRRQLEAENRRIEEREAQREAARQQQASQQSMRPDPKNRAGVAVAIIVAVVLVGAAIAIILSL